MLFIAFAIFLGGIGKPKSGSGLEGGSGVWPVTSLVVFDFRVLVLNSSKLFLASDLGFTGIPESGFRGPGLRGLDLGFWVSGGLGPCFAPEAPVVRPRASRPEADYPEGRLARRRILARRRTFNNRCAI